MPVGITYAPLLSPDGSLVNIIASVRDITRFREAEELKSTFISVISHELKTPVALIKGYVSTLRREDASWDREIVKDSLEVIEDLLTPPRSSTSPTSPPTTWTCGCSRGPEVVTQAGYGGAQPPECCPALVLFVRSNNPVLARVATACFAFPVRIRMWAMPSSTRLFPLAPGSECPAPGDGTSRPGDAQDRRPESGLDQIIAHRLGAAHRQLQVVLLPSRRRRCAR